MATIDEKLIKYKAELTRLEGVLEEQERYRSLKAQGRSGSETAFVDFEALHRRVAILENKISTIEAGLA